MPQKERSFFGIRHYSDKDSSDSETKNQPAFEDDTSNAGSKVVSIEDEPRMGGRVGAAAAAAFWLVVLGLPAVLLLSLPFTGLDLRLLFKISAVYLGGSSILVVMAFITHG